MALTTRATHVLQWRPHRAASREGERIKSRLSSDCSLQLDCMKLESLVIVSAHAVNTFPGLYTARHHELIAPEAGAPTVRG